MKHAFEEKPQKPERMKIPGYIAGSIFILIWLVVLF